MKNIAIILFLFSCHAGAADCPVNIGSNVSVTCTIPSSSNDAQFALRGAGGAGSSGCSNAGGHGGGRGNRTIYTIQGPIAGWSLTVTTGAGGYAPGSCGVYGNNGTHTYITLPGGCVLGAGGGERATTRAGAGGNSYTIGCDTAWFNDHPGVMIVNDNADSVSGMNAIGTLGGIGSGNGDGGAGGNGGNANAAGAAGLGGYVASVFR